MKYRTLTIFTLALFALFQFSSVASAQSWLMAKTDPLEGEYGEIVKNLQITTDEDHLIETLEKPGTENEVLFLKMLACKRLSTHGTAKSVATLAKMLADEKTAHFARYALEQIPAPEADEALWDATKTLKGKLLIGVVDSIANRKNPQSDPVLLALVEGDDAPASSDPELQKAVAAAFGAISSQDAVNVFASDSLFEFVKKVDSEGLQRRRVEQSIADAAFHCAEQCRANGKNADAVKIYQTIRKMDAIPDFQKESAVYHEILTLGNASGELLEEQVKSENPKYFAVALKAIRELPAGETITNKVLKLIEACPDPWRTALLIRALGDRTDAVSKSLTLKPIAELTKVNNNEIRIAAISALKNIGDKSVFPYLIVALIETDPEVAQAAQSTLEGIPGKEVDDAITTLIKYDDPATQIAGIQLIESRRIVGAFPLLKEAAQSPNKAVRDAALSALAEVVTLADLEILIDVLPEAANEEQATANQNLLKAACSRMPREEVAAKVVEFIGKAEAKDRPNLLDILMQIGGPTALKTVSENAWSNVAPMRNKATELLGKWREPEDANAVADICLKLAKDETHQYRTRGLRGYIRYPRQFPMDEAQRIKMVNTYLELATRPADRELVFQAFTKYPSAKMLEEAMKLVNDAQLSEKACEAAVAVADKLQGSSPATAEAMKKVLDKSKNETTKEKAKRVLDRQ